MVELIVDNIEIGTSISGVRATSHRALVKILFNTITYNNAFHTYSGGVMVSKSFAKAIHDRVQLLS